MPGTSILRRHALATQLACATILSLSVAFAPPADGYTLLVPIGGAAAGQLIAVALDHGATLVQRGPFGRSLVVRGERRRLLPLLGQGIVPLNARAAGCGQAA